MNDWKSVWERRKLEPERGSQLAQLMAADGLDTGFGDVGERAWRAFARSVADRFGLGPGNSVLEIGCGAGAFLLDFYERGITVAGVDRSRTLVDYARAAMPGARFDVSDALSFDVSARYDVVLSCGVYLYFESLEYAREVTRRMASIATRGVAVLDVGDRAREAAALAYRRAALGPEEYAKRYAGLEHLYLEREWLGTVLEACGLVHVCTEDQTIPGYANGDFRFNAYGFRR